MLSASITWMTVASCSPYACRLNSSSLLSSRVCVISFSLARIAFRSASILLCSLTTLRYSCSFACDGGIFKNDLFSGHVRGPDPGPASCQWGGENRCHSCSRTRRLVSLFGDPGICQRDHAFLSSVRRPCSAAWEHDKGVSKQ
eukprot:XP_001708352.1 Hypothetical protein GL50803_18854 [Giardia lamblia ATCC 50803]